MTLNALHAIVGANFAIKNKGQKLFSADVIEGNHILPVLFFCWIANQMKFDQEKIAEQLGTTWAAVSRYLVEADKLELNGDTLLPGQQLHRKLGLIQNGIRIYEMTLRSEKFYNQIDKNQ